MDKFKLFEDSFFSHLQSLFKTMIGKTNKELDEALILQSSSEEQKTVIHEVCQNVDKEHDMIEEMISSNKTPGEFLKKDIIYTVKEINPCATDGDVNQVVVATMDEMEKEIEHEASELTKEVTLLAEEMQTKSESKDGK